MQEIIDMLVSVVREVTELSEAGGSTELPIDGGTILAGSDAVFDSVDIVTIMVELELQIFDKYSVQVDCFAMISDGLNETQQVTIHNFSDYIASRIHG